MSDWLTVLRKSKRTCIQNGPMKKVHYDFGDGRELAEEWNMDLRIVTRRAWRFQRDLTSGQRDRWEIEFGDPDPQYSRDSTLEQPLIRENPNQPFTERRVTKKSLEWRIRNLPYPESTYSVDLDVEKYSIIVRTTNRKFYKVLPIPDLQRLHLKPSRDCLTFVYNKFKTLVLTYKKPNELMQFEAELFKDVQKLIPEDFRNNIDNCKPS